MYVQGHSRSTNLAPNERAYMTSYLVTIVTMAICRTFRAMATQRLKIAFRAHPCLI